MDKHDGSNEYTWVWYWRYNQDNMELNCRQWGVYQQTSGFEISKSHLMIMCWLYPTMICWICPQKRFKQQTWVCNGNTMAYVFKQYKSNGIIHIMNFGIIGKILKTMDLAHKIRALPTNVGIQSIQFTNPNHLQMTLSKPAMGFTPSWSTHMGFGTNNYI